MGKNNITYEQMLDLLRDKQYQAPDSWSQLEDSLTIQESISEMPTYKAPDNLWEGIEAGLDNKSTVPKSTLNNKIYLIAAGVLVLSILSVMLMYFLPGNSQPGFQYKSETETEVINTNLVQLDNEIADVLMYIESNSFLYEDQRMAEFKKQLEEINTALNQLMEMQKNYGTDESGSQIMAQMERERANLLKSMISSS